MSLRIYKQLITYTLISSLSANTVLAAQAGVKSKSTSVITVSQQRSMVQDVFSEYQYQMDDWNGSDKTYKEEADARLADNLRSLLDSGVSINEIQSQMESRILNVRDRKSVV